MPVPALRFGAHTLHPHTRTLEADGQPVPLGARAFDVLLALVERRDRVVGKAELLEAVWPDTVVEENNLQVQISTLRKVLGPRAIATIPGRGYQFVLPLESVPVPSGAAAAADAPEHGLIGRDRNLADVAALVRQHAILTIAGPGGVGKTVLARALLAGQAGAGREPVFVELAALRDPEQVAPALGVALGAALPGRDPLAALVAAIGQRKLLVALDNAEHLAAATGRLAADLHARAPDVRFVVTSQVPLGIPQEQVYRLEPLADGAASDLFIARASAADRRFALSEVNAEAIVEICRQLDGMPLAIELAAARVRELGLTTLRASLAERLRMIATRSRAGPARHQSLRATLEWSHSLLDDDERTMFRRLGVFSGGFTLALALAVAGNDASDWSAVDRLAALAERSLVAVSGDDPPRYAFPETMRAYALEQLQAAGDAREVSGRHARAMRDLFRSLHGAPTRAQFAAGRAELDNARNAIAWAREHEPALAVELAALAARYTVWNARRPEALAWLVSCRHLVDDTVARPVRAEWWLEFARFRLFNRHPDATDAARSALALFREERDDRGVVQALAALVRSQYARNDETRAAIAEIDALAARHPEWPASIRYVIAGTHATYATYEPEDYAAATRYRKEEATFAAAMGSVHAGNAAETNLIALLRAQDLHDEVRDRARALLARLHGTTETPNIAYASLHLLSALLATSRLDEARACAIEAWRACRAMNLPLAADPTSMLAALEGRAATAARLMGYTRALYARLDFQPQDVTVDYLERIEALLSQALDGDEVARLAAEGSQWDDETAFREAFAQDRAG